MEIRALRSVNNETGEWPAASPLMRRPLAEALVRRGACARLKSFGALRRRKQLLLITDQIGLRVPGDR